MMLRAYLPRLLIFTALGVLGGAGIAQAETAPPGGRPEFLCEQGEFCAWSGEFYTEAVQRLDLRTVNPKDCVALPDYLQARSFANRLDREVTIYQDSECSTEGEFVTYPGHGTFVPQAPFLARAVQIWE